MAYDIAAGLHYLHAFGRGPHGRLSSTNVLIGGGSGARGEGRIQVKARARVRPAPCAMRDDARVRSPSLGLPRHASRPISTGGLEV